MRRNPKVFISSVIHGLEKHREKIYEIISGDFQWKCNASGIQEEEFGGDPTSACFSALEASDLYLGLFWENSGSIIAPHNTFMTEMEFYHALNLRKYIRLYVLEADQRDPYLRLFLEQAKTDPARGQYIRFCTGLEDLLSKIRADLNHFGKNWFDYSDPWPLPSLLLEEEVKNLGLLGSELRRSGVILLERTAKTFDIDWLTKAIDLMRDHYQLLNFASAIDVGARILQTVLAGGPPTRNRQFLYLWADFLLMWGGACTWLGRVDDNFGALWAAKGRRDVYRTLEQWSNMHHSNSLIANCYYVHASLKKIKALVVDNREWERVFNREYLNGLRQAKLYDEDYIARVPEPFTSIMRPHILRELGDYDQAVRDLRFLMRHSSRRDKWSHVNTKSSLGIALVLKGMREGMPSQRVEGLSLLRESQAEAQSHHKSPFYVSVLKKVALGALTVGNEDEGKTTLKMLLEDSIEMKLFHQAWSIEAIMKHTSPFMPGHSGPGIST